MTSPLLGIDHASVDANRAPAYSKAAAAGVRLAILRGAYGSWIDPTLARDWSALGAAGLVRGAYLYLRHPARGEPLPSPEAQAVALVDAIRALGPRTPLDLPPALDVEFSGRGRIDTGLTAAQALDRVRRAWRVLHDAFGVPPIIYTSARVWRDDLANLPAPELAASPLWLARYPFKARLAAVRDASTVNALAWPPTPPPWGDPGNSWLHQYQGDAIGMPGFSSTVDLNRFRLLGAGGHGDRVRWVQRRLGCPVTGVYDAMTVAAVRGMQQRSGLAVDGVIGPRTWAALCWCGGVEMPAAA